MMIITYRNFFTSSFVITSWCLLHTGTYPLFCLLYLHEDHYILHPLHFLPCFNFLLIDTYRIFFTFLLCHNFIMIIIYRIFFIFTYVITSWRLLHTATFQLPPMSHDYDDQYKPHFFHFLLCYNLLTIYTYCSLSSSLYVITSWSSILTATFPLLLML